MCQTLEVSKSGFYDWLNRKPSKRKQFNMQLLSMIKEIHQESGMTYGSPRIHEKVVKRGYICEVKLVARLMKIANIRSKISKKYRISTTNSNHNYPISPNLLDRNFYTDSPNKVWVSDFTYIPVNNTWMYLYVIIDLFNREVIGWTLSENLAASNIVQLLSSTVVSQKPSPGLVFHSDRGIQYACGEFRELLKRYKMMQSMSRKGNCWDNAPAESFFKTLKVERVYHTEYENVSQAKSDLFYYIEIFYNRKRLHSYLEYTNPVEFRKMYKRRVA
jgi:putative transposase